MKDSKRVRAAPQPPTQALLAAALDRHRAGDVAAAERQYRAILRIAPSHFDALRLLGLALHSQQRNDEAYDVLRRAVKVDPRSPLAHSDLGLVLQALGRMEEAMASHDRALAIRPDHADAVYNRANVLLALERPLDALRGYDAALRLVPDFPLALNNKGLALAKLGRPAEALALFDRALAQLPSLVIAHANKADALMQLQQHEAAARELERAVATHPHLDKVIGHLLFAKMHICDWDAVAAIYPKVIAAVQAGQLAAVPFVLAAASASPEEQQACARIFARQADPTPVRRGSSPSRRDRIRVGYLSANFSNHATMILLGGLLERHDRSRFDILAFSALGDAAVLTERAGSAVERVIDVSTKDDRGIAAAFREQAIDIAVDLDGFAGRTRSFALASRPAPIQVSYLGFPGTMGAPWIDYILADRIVIPQEQQPFYDEHVVYLPDSYQVNDDRRRSASAGPSRAEMGLPETGLVFCSFNKAFKITREMFSAWMRLLGQVEDSVLWLLAGEPATERNLRGEAAGRGIAPERIVFAPAVPHADHLWRHRHADLFLDTLPCNAHTTASDALWAGLPVLTCLGTTFAGRVAASLLHATGLPELITPSLSEYEALALRLATDRPALSALRDRLEAVRQTAVLFDTDRFRQNVEAAYITMWERHCQGLAPAGFSVAQA